MTKSDYTYAIVDNIVVIEDLNQGRMSVTNDIENVIDEILDNEPELSKEANVFIYKDSEESWDIYDPITDDFYFLGETDRNNAIILAKAKYAFLQTIK